MGGNVHGWISPVRRSSFTRVPFTQRFSMGPRKDPSQYHSVTAAIDYVGENTPIRQLLTVQSVMDPQQGR